MPHIKCLLTVEYKMTDQGEISFILGISITRNHEKWMIHLSQPRYIEAILKKFGLYDCNPSSTPGDISVILKKDDGNNEEAQKNIPYREAVGSLMYLMLCTRPDIANPMIKLAQYAANFNNVHWTVVKHVFWYLKGSIDNVLTLGNVEKVNKRNVTLSGICDSNCTEDLNDR